MTALTPWAGQPRGLTWPTKGWETAALAPTIDRARLDRALGGLFDHGVASTEDNGVSLATVIIHGGRLVSERYGAQPETAFGPGQPVDENTTLISWSMAKSMTQAMLAILLDELALDIDAPVDIAEWSNDDRRTITLRHLLQMRDGLDFVEDYIIDEAGESKSDVIEMLFGSGADDVAAYARARPSKYQPGSVWSYSSGTTNILCGIIQKFLGEQQVTDFLQERIFDQLGMTSATASTDAAGNFIGSSYIFATARDFAKFGYLYLRGGAWENKQIVPRVWVEAARLQHATDTDSDHGYGMHWWIWKSITGCMSAQGYEGQRIIVMPQRDLVVVHLGKWVAHTAPALDCLLLEIVESFPESKNC